MILRTAEISDLSTVLGWITSGREARMWAGPKIRYPVDPEGGRSDMEASANNVYILVDAEGAIVGFCQILPKDDSVLHLARLIVAPELRGRGIGRDLRIAHMKVGASKRHAEYLMLNVYESNKAALRLYQSLGFGVKASDDQGAIAMIKPLTKASARIFFSAAAPKPAG